MNTLGKATLILAAVCFILTFAFKLALSGWMPFMGFGLGFSILFLVFSLVTNFSFYKNMVRSESSQFLIQSLGFLFVAVCFLVALNYVVAKNNKVFDWTDNKVNSLSDFSISVTQSIQEPLVFHYFHSDSPQVAGYERIVKSSIRKYQELSSKISFASHSIFQEPHIAKEFKVGNEESSLFAVYEGKKHRVTELTEASLTAAMLRLTKKSKKIYFTQNHQERDLYDKGTFGLNHFREEMKRLHYEVAPLNSYPIPEDAAFVAIVGPKASIDEEELKSLRDYVFAGGSLLIAADPGESHNLANLTKSFGIEFQNAFVFEKTSKMVKQSGLSVFVKGSGQPHELLKGMDLKNRPLLFMASPLKLASNDFTKSKVTPILSFEKSSVSHEGVDPASPIVQRGSQIAAAIAESTEKNSPYYRVFSIGDSDFLTNQFFSQHANFDFSLNLVSYMSKDSDMIHMRPRAAKTTYLVMTQTQMNFYFLFFIIPFVLLFFIVAIFLRLRRLF